MFSESIYALAILRNNDIASAGSDGTIYIWNYNNNNGSFKHQLIKHKDSVFSLLVLKDGDLVSGGLDNMINIWNAEQGLLKITIYSPICASTLIQVSNNLISGCFASNNLIIWNTNNGQLIRRITLENVKGVNSLAVFSNNDLAVGDGLNRNIQIVDLNNGIIKRTLNDFGGSENFFRYSLSVLNNGDLASIASEGSIKIWNPNDGKLKRTLKGSNFEYNVIAAFGNDSLIAGTNENFIQLWNSSDGTYMRQLNGFIINIRSFAFFQFGNFISAGDSSMIDVWQIWRWTPY
jgi:WD40 repeat protein